MSQTSQDLILLQPLPDPFVLGLEFGFHITDDLLEFGFVPDAVEKGIYFDLGVEPGRESGSFIKFL